MTVTGQKKKKTDYEIGYRKKAILILDYIEMEMLKNTFGKILEHSHNKQSLELFPPKGNH